ncbi:hypothetical protein [Cellulomonas sp. FA1]|uniref:hypothetical protein n=1 Tax=Cellulomonas sp. FA1 TaxID=1346710 RepID=UPI000B1F187E|nr:hypothetical protein [Cellulomonas sp. FA1]
MTTPPLPRANHPRHRAFTYLTGQYDNLGDALLRRAFISELAPVGEWHVYVGHAPSDYVGALDVPPGTVLYTSRSRWLGSAVATLCRRDRGTFFANPGEISSTPVELVLGTMGAFLAAAARAGGNPAFRLGVGARDRRRPLSLGHEVAARLVTRNVWRDAVSRDLFGRGDVAPDWAFALPARADGASRDLVVLSYRGDRPQPSDAALSTIAAWAASRRLRLAVVAQTRRDLPTSRDLAGRLGAPLLHAASGDLTEIESVARSAYARAVVVLSNRIHALIVAAVDGAAVGAVLAHPDVKIARTLAAGRLTVRPVDHEAGPDTLTSYLDEVAASRAVQAASVDEAAVALRALASEVLGTRERVVAP